MKIKERMSGMGGALLLSAALSFLVAVYAPLELFCGSQEALGCNTIASVRSVR